MADEKPVRKAISKKHRFEVFKRDSFKCQYCGKSAPDVILHVDHINPVKRGGRNNILNLTTSCIDCNLGKGARVLNDNSIITKQQDQLQELNERRGQLKLMTKWRDELLKIEEDQISYISNRIEEITNCNLNNYGRSDMKKNIKKFGFDLVVESLEKSANQYLEYDKNDNLIKNSIDKFVEYIPKICKGTIVEKDHPEIKEFAYICGIVFNRFNYFDKPKAWKMLKDCYAAGIDTDSMKDLAKTSKNWSEFYYTLEEWLG